MTTPGSKRPRSPKGLAHELAARATAQDEDIQLDNVHHRKRFLSEARRRRRCRTAAAAAAAPPAAAAVPCTACASVVARHGDVGCSPVAVRRPHAPSAAALLSPTSAHTRAVLP